MYLINYSKIMNKIYQSMQSTMEIFISSIIYGERYNGKTQLVKSIYKDSLWVDGSNLLEVQKALKENNYVVIENFEKISDLDSLNFEHKNIVAIYNGKNLSKRIKEKFAFIYHLPPLRERDEDIKAISNIYLQEAKEVFDIDENITIDTKDLDISKNLKSLKTSIYKSVLLKNIDKNELSLLLYNYFLKNYEGENIYKKQLSIFEKELIKAGLDIYKSQLKLSEILGINRNTLRKKVNEYL